MSEETLAAPIEEEKNLKKEKNLEEEKNLKEELQASVQNVEEKIDDAREKIEACNQKVVEFVTEKPLVAIAGAFVIGYLVGKLAAHRWFV